MRLESLPLFPANSFTRLCLEDFSRVAHLYQYDPGAPGSFRHRYDYLMGAYATDRQAVVAALKEYNSRLGAGPLALANLDRLQQKDSAVVITGQQAGIGTGPLYTIHKAISALGLARQLEAELGKPVIPLFWVAAEDHDFLEINHLFVPNPNQEIVKLELPASLEKRRSVGHIPLSPQVNELINQLKPNLAPTPWRDEIIELLRETAAASENLADWFARLMLILFRQQGLAMVNPLLPALRRLEGDLFQKALQLGPQLQEALEDSCRQVKALGLIPQVAKDPAHTNLFYYEQGQRIALLRDQEGFYLKDASRRWSFGEILALAQEEPERFSPNVVLRPLTQEVLFPVLAYVAGPGEMAYFALYREIYELLGHQMPVIYPRTSLTLVEPGVARLLAKYNLSLPEALTGLEAQLQKRLLQADEIGIDHLFARCRGQFAQAYAQLAEEIVPIDPSLKNLAHENLQRILQQVDYLENKVKQKHRQNHELLISHFNRIGLHLLPRGHWQERVFNLLPYLAKYGPELIDDLTAAPLPKKPGQHVGVYLNS